MRRTTDEQKQVLIFAAFMALILVLAVIFFYTGFQAGQNL